MGKALRAEGTHWHTPGSGDRPKYGNLQVKAEPMSSFG
jgi:hypothetical protein